MPPPYFSSSQRNQPTSPTQATMRFHYLNVFAILMAIIMLIATVSGQHDPGHDPEHPGHDPRPTPTGSIIGQCCSTVHCNSGCQDVSGTPNVATKHNLPANCKSFSGAKPVGTICTGKVRIVAVPSRGRMLTSIYTTGL